jgi:FG-GAP repeat.
MRISATGCGWCALYDYGKDLVIARATILILTLAATITAGACLGITRAVSSSPEFKQEIIPVGKGPGFVAIADVNHDGKLDLLVANEQDGSISVLLGDGKRHFTPGPGSPFAANPNPNDIAVADMNGDGNPDLVIANHQTPYITILLGDGRGSFAPAPHSPFATQSHPHPHGVAVGDFIGDGKPTVVTDSWGSDQILLLPSDGKGNLILPGKFFPTDGGSDQGVRAADFNKDGKLDIVTTGQKINAISLLLGNGKGGFRKAPASPFPAGAAAWAFTIDDINRDGNPDVLVIPYHRDVRDFKQLGVTVLLGDGKGGFTAMRGSPLSLAGCDGPDRVAAGDLAGSGLRDIVVSCALNNKVFFFLAAKDGSISNFNRSVPTGWGGIAIADLDGDGKADVVVSNNNSGTITILFGN